MDALTYLTTLRSLEIIKNECTSVNEIGAMDIAIKSIRKLQDYENTGISPEAIKKMDELYLEKCKEVNELKRIVSGNFTPEEYVRWHNVIVKEESGKYAEPFQGREHI